MKSCCRKSLTETLLAEARKNPEIIVLTSDARGSVTLGDYIRTLPDQFVEMGIAEQNMVGVAAGLASCGRIAFVCSPAAFLSSRALEQIKVDAVYSACNVKLCGVSGGLSYGALGGSHHSLGDIAAMRPMQGLQIWLPCDGHQTAAMVREMIRTPGPVYMRMGRGDVEDVYRADHAPFVPGKANILRNGTDLTLIATGELVWYALKAAGLLEQNGVSCRVLDMHTIKPLDQQAVIDAARDTKAIITVEEHSIYGGLGSAVAEVIAQCQPVPLTIMGVPDVHVIAGESPEVFRYYGLDGEGIAATVEKFLENI